MRTNPSFSTTRPQKISLFASGFLLLACCGITLPAHSQAVYGSIFGTVTDPSGAMVPNATVTVTDVTKGTSVTVQSNGSGGYTVQHLIPDTYRVEALGAGFNKSTTDNVIVYADT